MIWSTPRWSGRSRGRCVTVSGARVPSSHSLEPGSPAVPDGWTRERVIDQITRYQRIADPLQRRTDPNRPRPDGPLGPAAVLVPIVDHADGLTVLLTKRTDHLSRHAGQVAFPGGRIETSDIDPEDAALRET